MDIKYFDHPWKYAVVDDFLPKDTFDRVVEYSKVMGADTPVTELQTLKFNESGYESLKQEIITATEEFKNLSFDVLNTPQKNIEGASLTPYLHIREPGHDFCIHPDNWSKVLSLVLYIYPFEGQVGTEIYTSEENPQFVTEIKWKPNRMLAFVPSHNPQTLTNHKVYNFTDVNRVAVVINYLSGDKNNEFK